MTGNKTILSKYDDAVKEEVSLKSELLEANSLFSWCFNDTDCFRFSCLFIVPDLIYCALCSQTL